MFEIRRKSSLSPALRRALGVLFTASSMLACSANENVADLDQKSEHIIYGGDDRSQPWATSVVGLGAVSRASVAFVPETALSFPDVEHVQLNGPSLQNALGVCPDESFANEPVISTCSGTLVAEDLILTAGHCVSASNCNGARIVFGYASNPSGEVPLLSTDDVAECVEIVARSNASGVDFALVRIDHTPSNIVPVAMRVGDRPLALNERLFVVGHPTGLPQKVATNAWVSANRMDTLDYFQANLDVFPGNSGGGVFDEISGELVGLVARGPDGGYVRNSGETCYRAQRVADGYAMAIESTYVARAIDALCADSNSDLCSCGNGACDEALRETSMSCPDDCGSSCGDGVCNGSETSADCYADCGSCGNAVCEAYEVGHLSCCEDCGCPDGYSCSSSTCVARLGNVNQDDHVDEKDVALLGRRRSRSKLPSQADVDCNGSIDEQDRIALQARVDGQSTLLPCETPSDVAIGLRHSCVLAQGKVRCFGDNSAGQLGTSDRPPGASIAHSVEVPLPADVASLTVGTVHTCARLVDGRVACWGDNQFGQLGGIPARRGGVVLVPLPGLAVDVKAGAGHSCVLMDGGAVRCWGDNQFGQLGAGPAAASAEPFSTAVLPGPVSAIALGASHSCALMNDESVRCWGLNQFGQLGLGSTANLGDDEVPLAAPAIDVGGPSERIFAHWMQSCVIRKDGATLCWGDSNPLL